ncbi:MAG TPA: hypothetical protein PLF81_17090 [Candidatus Anammoximicrobium sp.]|nr:hypothetical protein [Candidatus Anammoximicrobium sp.]
MPASEAVEAPLGSERKQGHSETDGSGAERPRQIAPEPSDGDRSGQVSNDPVEMFTSWPILRWRLRRSTAVPQPRIQPVPAAGAETAEQSATPVPAAGAPAANFPAASRPQGAGEAAPPPTSVTQRQLVLELLNRWLGEDQFTIIDETDLPLERLTRALNAKAEETFGHKGCWVRGAYYNDDLPQAGTVEVLLYGTVFKEQQRKDIEQLANQLLSDDPVWRKVRPTVLTLSARQLRLDQPSADMRRARQRLWKETFEDPQLHGVLVDLVECFDPANTRLEHYDVYLWLDAEKAENQRGRMSELLTRHLGEGRFKILYEYPVPMSGLLATIQSQLRAKLGEGCYLAGLYFGAPADGGQELVTLMPFGRVIRDGHQAQIASQIRRLIDENPAWSDAPRPRDAEFAIDPRGLRMHTLSETLAEAQKQIRKSIRENPNLLGTWVELAECRNHRGEVSHVDVYVWLDRSRAEQQRGSLLPLIDGWLGAETKQEKYEILLPLTELVAGVRERVAAELKQEGCWVTGVCFAETVQQQVVQLIPFGRVFKDAQRAAVKRVCEEKIAADPAWKKVFPNSLAVDPLQINLDQPTEEMRPVVERLRQARDQLHRRVKEDADLHGVWLDLAPCFDHQLRLTHYDVYLWLDSARADAQRAVVAGLLDDWLTKESRKDIYETQLPLAALAADVQQRAQAEFGRRACWVSGAYYEPAVQQDTVALVLWGHAAADASKQKQQQDVIHRLCGESMAGEPAWGKTTPFSLAVTENLRPQLLPKWIEQARDELRRKCYEDKDLHGTWLDLSVCLDHMARPDHYHVDLWLDEGRADQQKALVLPLLDQCLGQDAKRIFQETVLPLSNFVATLQQSQQAAAGIDHCWVMGAYYNPTSVQPDTVGIVLYGNYFQDDQKARIMSQAQELISTQAAWRQLAPIVPRLEEKLQQDVLSDATRSLRTKIRRTLVDDLRLHGSWVDLAECRDHRNQFHHYNVYLWLNAGEAEAGAASASTVSTAPAEPRRASTSTRVASAACCDPGVRSPTAGPAGSARAAILPVALRSSETGRSDPRPLPADRQREEVVRLLDRWLGPQKYLIVRERQLPVDRLVAKLRTQMDPRLASGCGIRGAYFDESPAGGQDNVELVVYGQLAVDAERQRVLDLTQRLISGEPDWQSPPSPRGSALAVSPKGLRLKELSVEAAGLRDQIRSAIFADPQLHGLWVDLAECYDHRGKVEGYDAYVWLDNSRVQPVTLVSQPSNLPPTPLAVSYAPAATLPCASAGRFWRTCPRCSCDHAPLAACVEPAVPTPPTVENPLRSHLPPAPLRLTLAEQQLRVQSLLERWLCARPYRVVQEAGLPLYSLVEHVRAKIEPRWGNRCEVLGAYYQQQPNAPQETVEITLFGHFSEDSQKAEILHQARQLFDATAAWGSVPSPRNAAVVIVDRALTPFGHSARCQEAATLVQEAIADSRRLRGTRVELDECLDHRGQLAHYNVSLWLNETCDASDRRALAEVFQRVLGRDYRVVQQNRSLVADLVTRVNLLVEARPSLNGCSFQGGYYVYTARESGLERRLQLYGRVARPDQQQQVRDLLAQQLQERLSWRKFAEEAAILADDFAVVTPSPERGAALFSKGLELYRKGYFADASVAFQQAIVELPDSIAYRYWQILAELSQGREDAAYDHMLATMVRDPSPTTYRGLTHALQDVQGPIRVALMELENRARSEFYLQRREQTASGGSQPEVLLRLTPLPLASGFHASPTRRPTTAHSASS